MSESNLYYLKKEPDGSVSCYIDERTMMDVSGTYDATCTPAEWRAGGCYASVVDGKIVVGKNPEERKEELAEEFRKARYSLLRECDKMSPMRWISMTPELQQAWIDYRQALLDLPQQPGFPWEGPDFYMFWPIKPEG